MWWWQGDRRSDRDLFIAGGLSYSESVWWGAGAEDSGDGGGASAASGCDDAPAGWNQSHPEDSGEA